MRHDGVVICYINFITWLYNVIQVFEYRKASESIYFLDMFKMTTVYKVTDLVMLDYDGMLD